MNNIILTSNLQFYILPNINPVVKFSLSYGYIKGINGK